MKWSVAGFVAGLVVAVLVVRPRLARLNRRLDSRTKTVDTLIDVLYTITSVDDVRRSDRDTPAPDGEFL